MSEGRLERLFEVHARGSTLRTEFVAGTSTFLTMAYIIFVQPAVLSGSMFQTDTGLDFGAVMTATCLAAAFASALMGIWAKTPIALAPGMGQNFLFALTLVPAAAAVGMPNPAGTALGVVFVAGLLFLAVSDGPPPPPGGGHLPEHARRHRRGNRALHRVHRASERRSHRE